MLRNMGRRSFQDVKRNILIASYPSSIDESGLPEPESMSKPAYIHSCQPGPLESANKPPLRETLTPSAPRLPKPNPVLKLLAGCHRLRPRQPEPESVMHAARHDAARPAPEVDGPVSRPTEDALWRPLPVVHVFNIPRCGKVVVALGILRMDLENGPRARALLGPTTVRSGVGSPVSSLGLQFLVSGLSLTVWGGVQKIDFSVGPVCIIHNDGVPAPTQSIAVFTIHTLHIRQFHHLESLLRHCLGKFYSPEVSKRFSVPVNDGGRKLDSFICD
ncbi:hypothetical protein LX36DRAFT_39116 [Colletotrichum falcatum]|nr:hypothetical protein LX36DRAFT_39116 [Colletotrichum falcatum]